ncbi:MAG: hypothetical protein GX620_16155 [Chloroflexi bacterium]|nr:hypothetical protein [Chloroflexota bacterium]
MPTLSELVSRVSFLAAMPAVIGLFVTAGILAISREWRLNVFALTLQYFFVVLLLTRQIRLEVAAVKGLIGWMICMVFYLTERRSVGLRQVPERDPSQAGSMRWQRWMVSARASFALLATIMVSVAAYTAALRLPLPEVPGDISLACYVLAGLGLLLIGLSEAPMQVGFGLLTFLSGFDLFYVALEPSLAVAGLFGAISLLIALAVTYLRSVEIASGSEGQLL